MTVLFFVYLAALQLVLAAAGCAIVLLISALPSVRRHRIQVFRAVLFACAGAFAGVTAAFVGILATGFSCRTVSGASWEEDCVWLADSAPWVLLAGYVVALVGGGLLGARGGLAGPSRELP